MSLVHSPQIVTDGLAFYYDMNNAQKSWRGKPTTNFIYTRNARDDATYASYSATASGTWNAKHPDAIRVYNDLGSEISAYSNTGVTDWTNTYHAIWTLDPILKRPVVTMRDYDGNWKAKRFGIGQTMTSMGLTTGSTYTLSWLQWTDDITKSTNAGVYGQNTSGTNNFHDGLSNSISTSYNTQPYTWQRVYATFTVSAAWNLSAGLSCYMYGHFIKRGTLRIADVQLEVGTPSGFSKAQIRTNTESIIDLTNNNTVTANSLTYAADGTFSFVGAGGVGVAGNHVSCGNAPAINFGTGNFTLSFISYRTADGYQGGSYVSKGDGTGLGFDFRDSSFYVHGTTGLIASIPFSQTYNIWQQHDFVFDRSSSPYIRYYLNGVFTSSSNVNNSGNVTATINTNRNLDIGRSQAGGVNRYFNGNMPLVKLYNRALSAAEVQQNFNALRGRYGV